MTSRLVDTPNPRADQDVDDWRIDRLLELGFQKTDALLLALAGVDWHDARRLLDAGCDHETATRILA